MKEKADKERKRVLKTSCPLCRSVLWVDTVSGEVIQTEKRKKVKSSLDELLLKEKNKASEADRRFDSSSAMEKEKRKEAQKQFAKALYDIDKNSE